MDSMAVWIDQMGIWDEPDRENEEEMDDRWRRSRTFFSFFFSLSLSFFS